MNDTLLDKLKESITAFNSIGELLGITPANASSFWQDLIQLMKDLGAPTTGINTDDQTKILNFIQAYCDLPDKETGDLYVSYIFDALAKVITGEDTDGGFWNESVQEMLEYFYNHFKSDSVEDAPIGSSLFTRAHLKNANAGLSFVKLPWVEPWFNMDGDTFSEVRGHDSVNDILRNRHKMQYTHTQDQMEIDGQGAYDEYGYTKYYLYPDVTGDDAVTAQVDSSLSVGTGSLSYNDQRMLQTLYALYNEEGNKLRKAFYDNSTIQEAYDYLKEYLQEAGTYTVSYLQNAVNGIAARLGFASADESVKLQYYYNYVAALFGKDLDLEDSAYHTILFVQWCIDNQEAIESKYNIKMTISEKYNADGSKNGLVSISISPNNAVTFGEIYREFCEEQGFRVPYLLILDDPVKNSAALGKWLRLLMPQYGRRVEVEDLDRNFWVIAQVIAGLSNFLFDDDAPIPSLLKQMADEVVQLWENILYLWIEVAVASQKATPTVRVLDIPLPNDEERPWRKFDGFENALEDRYYGFISTSSYFGIYNTQNGDTLRRCKPYADKYPNENLIIIAHQRLMNYRQNFYACEYYPEVFCYHCGTRTWKTYSIRMHLQKDLNKSWGTGIDPKTYYINGCPITLHKLDDTKVDDSFFAGNLHDHPSSIWAASGLNRLESLIGAFSIEDYGYTTFSPCDNPPDPEEDSNLYYGAVRCIPHVEYDLTVDDIKITNFYIDIYDASAMIRNENLNEYHIAKVGLEDNAGFGTQMGIDEENQIIYCKMNYLVEEAPVLELEDHNCIAQPVTHQALYMGEVASYYAEEGEKPIFNGLYFGKIIAAPADDETARRANIADGTLTSGGKALVNLLSNESAYDVDKSLVIATAGSNSIEGYNAYGPYELGYRYYTSTGLVYGSNLQRYDVYHASTDGGLVVTFQGQTIERSDFVFNARDWYEYYGYDTVNNKYYSQMTQFELYSPEDETSLYEQFYIRINYLIYMHSLNSDAIDMAFLVPSDYACNYDGTNLAVTQKQILDFSGLIKHTSGQDWRAGFDLSTLKSFGSGEYYIINDLTSLSDSRLTYADNFMSLSDSIKYLENGDSGFFLTEDEKLYVAKEFDIE